MASPGNQHCASCIGTLSFPIAALYVRSCPLLTLPVEYAKLGLCEGWVSVRPTVCLSRRSTAAAAAGEFAAERPVADIDRQAPALSSKRV